MRRAVRRRWIAVLLVALTVWPFVHRVLVDRAELNPWRFFGFAMYCVPRFPIGVEVFGVEAGGRRKLALEPGSRLHDQAHRFAFRRDSWGRWVEPAAVGAAALEANPGLSAAEVGIVERSLDPATARIRRRVQSYLYRREVPSDS